MDLLNHFKERIFAITPSNFDQFALELFNYQVVHNKVYKSYCDHLKIRPSSISKLTEIPFLPIDFFKQHVIKSGDWSTQRIFKSSGTTSTGRSEHHIEDEAFYHEISWKAATGRFGDISKKDLLALLPSYLEQGDSSLVNMIGHFMDNAGSNSGFYLADFGQLKKKILSTSRPIILFGVSYALLDFAESDPDIDLSNHIVVETGGMKGRKKEITTAELHDQLKKAFNHPTIFTEYGMTELLSQAYGIQGELKFPNWSRPLLREIQDPFNVKTEGSGALNVIDLANIHSIAFIETKDLVTIKETGFFNILGRMDNSDIRGCSLLI